MRSLELDVHSSPALRERRESGPIVCHATGVWLGQRRAAQGRWRSLDER
ncbi:MAG: hypothetical protein H0U42_06845 [Thermoleophilaceae bacterium]|nr:hypothetical protein [Thermoleophilaceae bacterium]